MSTSRIHARARIARALILSVLVVAGGAIAATSAIANGSSPVTLDWTQAAVYDLGAASGYDRTWLGYVTSPNPIGPIPNGTQTPSGGAAGDTVTPTSPRGADTKYVAKFPAQSGSSTFGDPSTTEGEYQFKGTITWTAPGHNLVVTFVDPRVVFNGDGTGHLYASGTSSLGGSYDDSTGPVFDLDLDGEPADGGASASQPGYQAGWDAAKWQVNWDGSISLTGIIVRVATPNTTAIVPFGGSYGAGVGPDRLPHRFGTMALNFPAASGPQGPVGTPGPQGPAGPAGPAGPVGKAATIKTVILKRAAFKKRSRLTAKVVRGKRLIGYATVIGRKVRVVHVTKRLKGRYRLYEMGGKKRRTLVRLG